MGRLIDADELLQTVEWDIDYPELESIVQNMKAVDAVPVVRCGDCIHGKEIGYVMRECEKRHGVHESDWFCGDGKKREEA